MFLMNGKELFVGRGVGLFAPHDANSNPTKDMYGLGLLDVVEFTTQDNLQKIYDLTVPGGPLGGVTPVEREPKLSIQGRQMNTFNLALFSEGNTSTVVQAGTAVVAESLNPVVGVIPGCVYATAKKNIGSVVVKKGATTYVLNTDYAIRDANDGLIEILEGGTIIAGDLVTVDYTPVAKTYKIVQGATSGGIHGYFRFAGNPARGNKFTFEAWDVLWTPNGGLGLVQQSYGMWKMDGLAQSDSANHPTEPVYKIWDRTA